jgi:hypothetical protein
MEGNGNPNFRNDQRYRSKPSAYPHRISQQVRRDDSVYKALAATNVLFHDSKLAATLAHHKYPQYIGEDAEKEHHRLMSA